MLEVFYFNNLIFYRLMNKKKNLLIKKFNKGKINFNNK